MEWTPSDPDWEARASIDERVKLSKLEGVVKQATGWILGSQGGTACNDGTRDGSITVSSSSCATTMDASRKESIDLVLCINMIHIAPWEATLGLMECAGNVLRKGGILMCYGPYRVNGEAVESNL